MTHSLLEIVANLRDEKDDRLLPHQIRRQILTESENSLDHPTKKDGSSVDPRSKIPCRCRNCTNPSCGKRHPPVRQNCTQNTSPDAQHAHIILVHARTFTRTRVWLKISECTSKVISSFVVMSFFDIQDFDFSFFRSSPPISSPTPTDHAKTRIRVKNHRSSAQRGVRPNGRPQTQVISPTSASTLARSTRRSMCPRTASTRTRQFQSPTSSPPRSVRKAAAAGRKQALCQHC